MITLPANIKYAIVKPDNKGNLIVDRFLTEEQCIDMAGQIVHGELVSVNPEAWRAYETNI